MLRVNLADGRTLFFDLSVPEQLKSWQSNQAAPSFQASIRGLAVSHRKNYIALPVPAHFSTVAFSAAPLLARNSGAMIGELIACQVDDIEVSCTVYHGDGELARLDLKKTGRPRFRPRGQPWPPVRRDSGR